MLSVISVVLLAASLVLLLDVAGAGQALIRNLTSKSLGTLAPGYAATPTGFKVYAGLLGTIGVILAGLEAASVSPLAGAIAAAAGLLGFVLLSIVSIGGEVRTYRALKR